MSEAKRYDTGKPRLDKVLNMAPALHALAEVMIRGEEKYPNDESDIPNWMLGGKPDSEYLASALRHLESMVYAQEVYDQEMGTMHAAHVIWNMGALITCNYPDAPRAGHQPLWKQVQWQEEVDQPASICEKCKYNDAMCECDA